MPVFQTTGGTTNVAFGQGTVDASGQGQHVIAVADRAALDRILSTAGLGKSELNALTEAMTVDGAKPGNKVMAWVKENASKVLSGGVQVGTKIGYSRFDTAHTTSEGLGAPYIEGQNADGKLIIEVVVYTSDLPQTVDGRKEAMLQAVGVARAAWSFAFGAQSDQLFDKWTFIHFFDMEKLLNHKGKDPVNPDIGYYENGELVLR